MAEVVHRNVEEFIPELEQLERVGLFTTAEARSVLKMRTAHEYKLTRKTKCKEDYLSYIQYLINLISLVNKRRKRLGYFFKKEEIEYSVTNRIHKLFKAAQMRFKSDLSVWMTHIAFCKKWKKNTQLSKLFTTLLQIHSKPELWVMAAKWELECHNDVDSARQLLLRAIRLHQTSKLLWREYIRLELLYSEKLRKRLEVLGTSVEQQTDSEDSLVLSGEAALIIINEIFNKFPGDVKLYLQLLEICKNFDFTDNHINTIYNTIESNHMTCELAWSALAQRPLLSAAGITNDEILSEKESESCKIYEKAITVFPTEIMWSLYLRSLLQQLNQYTTENSIRTSVERILLKFRQAHDSGLLVPELYTPLIELLMKTGELSEANDILKAVTMKEPTLTTPALWQLRLDVLFSSSHNVSYTWDVVRTVCQYSESQVSLPVWLKTFEWCNVECPAKIEELVQMSKTKHREIYQRMKDKYLHWTLSSSGVKAARKLYKQLVLEKPLSLDFYRNYIQAESSLVNSDIKQLRLINDEAIRDYGHQSPVIWLEYITLEQTHADGEAVRVTRLYNNARKTLKGSMNAELITKLTLIQSGHTNIDCEGDGPTTL